MIRDDDVMRLFEQADPARLPDRVDDPVDGSDYLTTLRQRSIHVTLTEPNQTEARPAAGRRWAWIGAAAAAAFVVVGGLVLLTRDDTSPSTAPSTDVAGLAADVGVAERFIVAFNDRDLAAMEEVSAAGLTMKSAVTVDVLDVEGWPSLLAWYEAFDWRWDGAICAISSPGVDVQCEVLERNRLTDLTGARRPATVTFAVTDGEVETVAVAADLSDYSPNAFAPFRSWVRLNHPDDVSRMWTGDSPVLTAESAALFDRHLTEYADDLRSTTDE